jgi:hypothetical protein
VDRRAHRWPKGRAVDHRTRRDREEYESRPGLGLPGDALHRGTGSVSGAQVKAAYQYLVTQSVFALLLYERPAPCQCTCIIPSLTNLLQPTPQIWAFRLTPSSSPSRYRPRSCVSSKPGSFSACLLACLLHCWLAPVPRFTRSPPLGLAHLGTRVYCTRMSLPPPCMRVRLSGPLRSSGAPGATTQRPHGPWCWAHTASQLLNKQMFFWKRPWEGRWRPRAATTQQVQGKGAPQKCTDHISQRPEQRTPASGSQPQPPTN